MTSFRPRSLFPFAVFTFLLLRRHLYAGQNTGPPPIDHVKHFRRGARIFVISPPTTPPPHYRHLHGLSDIFSLAKSNGKKIKKIPIFNGANSCCFANMILIYFDVPSSSRTLGVLKHSVRLQSIGRQNGEKSTNRTRNRRGGSHAFSV